MNTFRLIENLYSTDEPISMSINDLIDVLVAHYSPKLIEIAERHTFWYCRQGENQSVANFLGSSEENSCAL